MTVNDILSLLLKRLDHQDRILEEMDRKLTDHIAEEIRLHPSLEEMAEMWGRSKAVAWFFTKLASLIAIVAAGWSWAKDHLK